jgi:outer membrane receptor protein involved in Fe transport
VALTWKRQSWGAGVSAYYIGDYTDSGATTTQTTYESLGSPGYIAPVFTNGSYVYRYVVKDSVSYNAYVSYRFKSKSKWLGDTSVRFGVVNLTDEIPPLSSDSRGYDPSVYNLMARGRSWSFQITRRL